MKKIIILTAIVLSSCAPQYDEAAITEFETSYEWAYEPFGKDASMPAKQAVAICKRRAVNSAISSTPNHIGAKKSYCSASYNNNGYFLGSDASMSCREYTDPNSAMIANSRNQQQQANYASDFFKSCMAEKGWDAFLVAVPPTSIEPTK